jgi:hypothetical protein
MTTYGSVVVPAIPPKGPPLSLMTSAILPTNATEETGTYPDWIYPKARAELQANFPDLWKQIAAELDDRDATGEEWVRGFRYAPENHYAGELRGREDYTSVDDPALNAPGSLALAAAAGGTLVAGSYGYQVTAVDANGETTPCTEVDITTGSTGSVKLTWKGVRSGATYNVYGRVHGSLGLLATVGPFDRDNPPTYTDTGAATVGAAPPSSNTTGGTGTYTNLPIVEFIPYLIVARDFCSSWGFEERDFKGRALRLLDNQTPAAIETEFETGAIAQALGYPNNYLCNTSDPAFVDVTPKPSGTWTPPSVARGFQILQDALQQCGFGGQGMIHVIAETVGNLLNVRREGALMLDVLDNIVVPGSGYRGQCSGVGGGNSTTTAVMFATDLVSVRAQKQADVIPDTFAEALDRSQGGQPNKIEFRAMRFAAASFDGACHFACRVTLAT